MQIEKDLKRLGVDTRGIYLKYKSLEGTRRIIQYENDEYVFTLSKTIKPKIECFGVTNRCVDGKRVLFLDYDNIYRSVMLKNLQNLLELYPNEFDVFYIATTGNPEKLHDGRTKGSYHVISFTKLYKEDVKDCLKVCDVDPFFIKIPEKTAHKCQVLRCSSKFYKVGNKILKEAPKFSEIYPTNPIMNDKPCSYAHYDFFRNMWDIPTNLIHKFDEGHVVELHQYSTPKGAT